MFNHTEIQFACKLLLKIFVRREQMRADARERAERASPRWRWFFYPHWWYETGQDLRAARGSAVGLMLFGVVFLVLAGLTAFGVHP